MTVRPLLDAWRDYLSMRPEPVVEDWFGRFDWNLSERDLPTEKLHAVRHLADCAPHVGKAETRLANCFLEYADRLNWMQMYGPEEFGRYFTDNYAHVELLGTRGHFVSDEIAGGIVLYGPQVDYPNHWHVAEEIYIPLTGNGLWSSDNADYVRQAAGTFIFHESNMPHATKCEDTPLLALWVWRGGDLAQKGNY